MMWKAVAILGSLAIGLALSYAQTVLNPAPTIAVCAYNASPPTAVSGTFVYMQCNSLGQLQ